MKIQKQEKNWKKKLKIKLLEKKLEVKILEAKLNT